ncbi:hypothetical protein [Catellatospora sichuanensis]|uniref:hypothetical protein n=1 Tax=Catellatospora sichuanensis TaxID=1969805 RepID=UPI00118385DB|nr:hypothetical protein [Catellatospora sichuanensis]
MISTLMASIAVCMLILAGLAARRRSAAGPAAALVAVICVGLAYDSGAVAIGRLLGFGSALEAVNAPRFWIHAVFTPLLIVAAAALAARLGVTALARRAVRIAGGVLVTALIALGVADDIIALRLEPRGYADTLRYGNAATAGPPIPAIVTMVVLVVIGVLVWRVARFPWLCLGALAMFAAAAAGAAHFWLGNVGELLLQLAVVATVARAARAGADPALPQPSQPPLQPA